MQDKVVVVVSATGGIGSAVAHKLAKSVATLAIAARSHSRNNQESHPQTNRYLVTPRQKRPLNPAGKTFSNSGKSI